MQAALYPAKPFMMVPYWLLFAPVGLGAFKLYAALLYYGNTSRSRHPSKRTLAMLVGRCEKSVERYIVELEKVGLLVRRTRQGRTGRSASNEYVLYEPSNVDEIADWMDGSLSDKKRWLKSVRLGQVPKVKRKQFKAGKLHPIGDKLIPLEFAKFFQPSTA